MANAREARTRWSSMRADFSLLSSLDAIHPVRIALGVMVAPSWRHLRDTHRTSWMQEKSVCQAKELDTWRGCSVTARFVLDYTAEAQKTMLAAEAEEHRDLVWMRGNLGEKQGIALGEKALGWTGVALQAFPAATHIGKVDADTYVNPALLVFRLGLRDAQHPLLWLGHFIASLCPALEAPKIGFGCTCPPRPNCTFQMGVGGDCWVYAQGGFYAFSRQLATAVAERLPRAPCREYSMEDATTGSVIHQLAREQSLRVVLVHERENTPLVFALAESDDAADQRMHKPALWRHLYHTSASREAMRVLGRNATRRGGSRNHSLGG